MKAAFLLRALLLFAVTWCQAQRGDHSKELQSTSEDMPLATAAEPECSTSYDHQRKRIEELERRLQHLEAMVSNSGGSLQKYKQGIKDVTKAFVDIKTWIVTAIPPTDEACAFDWQSLSCTPSCHCMMQAKLGDLSPSRACRLRQPHELEPNCVGHQPKPSIMHKAVNTALEAVANQTSLLLAQVVTRAPSTDDDCKWSWKKMRCVPSGFCRLDPEWGDFSLSRACRFRTDYEE